VNKDPHNAWMIAVTVADPGEASDLFDSVKYAELTK
jgi:glycine cleavage system H lipoate-binding protein